MTSLLNVGYGTTNPKKLIHLVQNNVALRLQDIRASGDRTTGVEFMIGGGDAFSSNNYDTDWRIINSNALFCIQSGTSNITNNVMNFTKLGNVGIGTTQPRSRLDVVGNMTITGDIIPSSNSIYNLGSSSNKWKDLYLSGNSIFLDNTVISSDSSSNLNIKDKSGIYKNININTLQLNDSGKQMVLGLDTSGRLTYTNASNITSYAITTTNIASANLDSSILSVDKGGTGVGTFAIGELLIGNGASNVLQNANLKWDNTNSRLGIGTSAPENKLHICEVNTSNTRLMIQNNYATSVTNSPLPAEIVIAGTFSSNVGSLDRCISFPYTTDTTGLGQTQYTFAITENLICDILVVGGGGGGSGGAGGGGGAGQMVLIYQATLNSGNYTIKVGKGGVKAISNNDLPVSYATKGIDSSFDIVIAEGGGANGSNINDKNGGSGAGGDPFSPDGGTSGFGIKNTTIDTFSGAVVYSKGNNGGNNGGNNIGGGGGGSGQAGSLGKGGDGLSGISEINYDFKSNFGTRGGKVESDGLVWFAGGGVERG